MSNAEKFWNAWLNVHAGGSLKSKLSPEMLAAMKYGFIAAWDMARTLTPAAPNQGAPSEQVTP